MRTLIVTAAVLSLLVPAGATADTGVVGDDTADAYDGIGSLLLARTWTGTAQDRDRTARCPGCRWLVQRSCRSDHSLCHMEQLPACPAGMVRFDVSVARDVRSPLVFKGTTCIGPGGPPTSERVERGVVDRTRVRLAPLKPRLLTAVAVADTRSRVTTGSPTALTSELEVLGQPVRLTASGQVRWVWSDGLVTNSGSPVSARRWGRPGTVAAEVSVVWSAWYWVDGLGPFRVRQPVHQSASLRVHVRDVKPVLVFQP